VRCGIHSLPRPCTQTRFYDREHGALTGARLLAHGQGTMQNAPLARGVFISYVRRIYREMPMMR
jgi:hypothetical protein